MTARTIRIKARDVVEGMQNTEGMTVTGIDRDHETVAFRFGPVDTTMDLDLDAMVEVMLSGPSPRQECCAPFCKMHDISRDGDVLHGWLAHHVLCPVRRLRLRLWPVGATWAGHAWRIQMAPPPLPEPDQSVRFRDPGSACWSLDVMPADLQNGMILHGDAAEVITAFCEPKVQPCHNCQAETDAGPCPGCGKVFCQRCAEKPYAFCCEPE